MKQNFILAFSSVFITLCVAELALRLFYPLIANYDLEMWRYDTYLKVYKGESHRNRTGGHIKNLYGADVSINSKGLRDREYDYKKIEGVCRILVLGDSSTLGWGVPLNSTYSKRLESLLNAGAPRKKYEVINAGVCNYNTKDEVSFLKDEGLKYAPDAVILGYSMNDPEPHAAIRRLDIRRHSYLCAFIVSRWHNIRVKITRGLNYADYYRSLYSAGAPGLADYNSAIEDLKATTRTKRIPLLVALIPDLHDLKNDPFADLDRFVANKFSGYRNVRVLDLAPAFSKSTSPRAWWVSSEDAHPNADAQEIIAGAIYPEIIKSACPARP